MIESEGWVDFHTAMNLLANSRGSLLIARRDLVDALKDGKIQSAATKKVRHPETDELMFEHDYLLDPLHWDMDHQLRQLFAAAEAQKDMSPDELVPASPDFSVRLPEDIRLWEKDFVAIFPDAGQSHSESRHADRTNVSQLKLRAEPKNTGGNPGKHDWEGAFIEMARIAILEEDSSRPALTRAVLEWFGRQDKPEPPPSLLRAKVKLFHESIWPPKT